MAIDKDDIMKLAALTTEIKEFADAFEPTADEIVEVLVNRIGPRLGIVLDALYTAQVDRTANRFKRLTEEHEFTREEAMLLIVDANATREVMLRNAVSKKSS